MAMSDYVRLLRELIGKQLLLMPSVSVLVQDDDDRLLLVRHADSGLWGLVGGAVEVDERPDEAAIRETQEETGLRVELTRLVTALGGPGFRVTYPNGDETAYVTIVYEARPVGGVERADGDEVLELGWFGRNDLLAIDLGAIAQATLRELGWLPGVSSFETAGRSFLSGLDPNRRARTKRDGLALSLGPEVAGHSPAAGLEGQVREPGRVPPTASRLATRPRRRSGLAGAAFGLTERDDKFTMPGHVQPLHVSHESWRDVARTWFDRHPSRR